MLENYLQGFEQIEKHPVFETAEQTPVFVLDEKVYVPDNSIDNVDVYLNYYERFENKIPRTTRKPLLELGNLSFLDELMNGRSNDELLNLQIQYVDLFINKHFEDFMLGLGVEEFIFKKVFPYLRTKKYDEKIADLFGIEYVEIKNVEKSIEPDLETLAQNFFQKKDDFILRIERESERTFEKTITNFFCWKWEKYEGSSILGKIINRINVAFIKNCVYELVEDCNGQFDSKINVDGKIFYLKQTPLTVKYLEQMYNYYLSKEIRINALKEHLTKDKLIEKLQFSKNELPGIRGINEYSEQNFGFIKTKNDECYVCLEVPVHAVHSQYDGKYYFFKKTRVGINVYKSNSTAVISFGDGVFMIENNNHPILHGNKGDFARLCLGNNEMPTKGKDSGEILAKRLRKARDIVLYGYLTSPAICDELRTVCTRCREGHFNQNIRELSELEKLGVPILEGGSVDYDNKREYI